MYSEAAAEQSGYLGVGGCVSLRDQPDWADHTFSSSLEDTVVGGSFVPSTLTGFLKSILPRPDTFRSKKTSRLAILFTWIIWRRSRPHPMLCVLLLVHFRRLNIGGACVT